MIMSTNEFLILVDQEDKVSQERLRLEPAPEAVWKDVLINYPPLKRIVTQNKVLPLSILYLLAGDADPLIRFDIARKRSLPIELFKLLSEDSDESVRATVARNPKAPLNIVKRLAEDTSSFVSCAARERLGDQP